MTPWLEPLALGAALVLIASFWIAEWREERQLQLRRQVQARQRREQWERYIRRACGDLARERRTRRHARWME